LLWLFWIRIQQLKHDTQFSTNAWTFKLTKKFISALKTEKKFKKGKNFKKNVRNPIQCDEKA
jgi:hypothetical protein